MLLSILALLVSEPLTEAASRHFGDLPISTFNTYLVEGKGPKEVAESLQVRRPVLADGSQAYAVTTWRLPMRWTSDAFGECSPATVRIAAEFDVTLPVLSRDAALELTEKELAKWHDYMDFLAAHEARRMKRVLDGARALEQRMRSAGDCEPFEQMLGEGVRGIGASARALDVEVAEEFEKMPSTRRGFP